MEDRHLQGVRREERLRNRRKMRVSGKMTATLNAIRKGVAATLRQASRRAAGKKKG